MKAKAEAEVEELQGATTEGAALEACSSTGDQGEGRCQRLGRQQGVLLEVVAEGAVVATGVAGGANRGS